MSSHSAGDYHTAGESKTVTAGGTASFSVVASGSLPLSYQWSFWRDEYHQGPPTPP